MMPTLITVTYGSRRAYVLDVIRAAVSEGIEHVVVVDNGASWDVRSLIKLTTSPTPKVDVIAMGGNTGSAAGFAAGIRAAMRTGAELLWMLDDDTVPIPSALSTLLNAYGALRKRVPEDRLAVVGYRLEHQPAVARGVVGSRLSARRSSFRGFHVLDLPVKVWRRTRSRRVRTIRCAPPTVMLDHAPYSGLLIHRAVVEKLGLPREDFVLYGDDTEFTHRIAEAGGTIALVTAAKLVELEPTWHTGEHFGTGFERMLLGEGDVRAYYMMRNGTYFDAHCIRHVRWVLWLNRRTYMTILWLFSFKYRRRSRYRLIARAVEDGLAGRLGVAKDLQGLET